MLTVRIRTEKILTLSCSLARTGRIAFLAILSEETLDFAAEISSKASDSLPAASSKAHLLIITAGLELSCPKSARISAACMQYALYDTICC